MKNFSLGLAVSFVIVFIWSTLTKPFNENKLDDSIKSEISNESKREFVNSGSKSISIEPVIKNKNAVPANKLNHKTVKTMNEIPLVELHNVGQDAPSSHDSGDGPDELRKLLLDMIANAKADKLKRASSALESILAPNAFESFVSETTEDIDAKIRESELESSFLQAAPYKGLAVFESVKCKETICKVIFKLTSEQRLSPFPIYFWDKTLITLSFLKFENYYLVSTYFPLDKSNPEGYKLIFSMVKDIPKP